MAYKVQVRSYGWYCPRCEKHKTIPQIKVVKVRLSTFATITCQNCSSEMIDCFLIKLNSDACEVCEDRFLCLTRTDAIVETQMQTVRGDEIHRWEYQKDPINISGIRSYTGRYTNKLEQQNYCMFPDREDCNYSKMRYQYRGTPYNRCTYMKYDKEYKSWYCVYGVNKRGKEGK